MKTRRRAGSTEGYASAASDVYKRQVGDRRRRPEARPDVAAHDARGRQHVDAVRAIGGIRAPPLIHISQPTRQAENPHAGFCLQKKK